MNKGLFFSTQFASLDTPIRGGIFGSHFSSLFAFDMSQTKYCKSPSLLAPYLIIGFFL
jgi:hypothetical protein